MDHTEVCLTSGFTPSQEASIAYIPHKFFHFLYILFTFALHTQVIYPLFWIYFLNFPGWASWTGGLSTLSAFPSESFRLSSIRYLLSSLHLWRVTLVCCVWPNSGGYVISNGLCSKNSFHSEYIFTEVPTQPSLLEGVLPGLHPHFHSWK